MAENKELTALKYFTDELSKSISFTPGSELETWYNELVNKAIQMEREQIERVAMYHKDNSVGVECIRSYINKHYIG
jgi:hypothetical protein